MKKQIKENCIVFSIYDLYKSDVLEKEEYIGSITWAGKYNNKEDKISFNTNKAEKYIELQYNVRNYGENKWRAIKYKIPLTTSACNYGRSRLWLVCPNNNESGYCGKKVAKLYLAPYSDHFVCRYCLNLSYESRNKNKNDKYYYLDTCFNLEKKIKQLKEEIKIQFRSGEPTKKYQELIKTNDLLHQSIRILNQKLKSEISNFVKK